MMETLVGTLSSRAFVVWMDPQKCSVS
jgi:hypothetical protein